MIIPKKDIFDFLRYVDGDTGKLVLSLREIILNSSKKIEERMTYGIPFYYYFGRLCYLNTTKKGLDIAFCKGIKLSEKFEQIERKNRKEVATITVNSLSEIDKVLLRKIMMEAMLLNEIIWSLKNSK